MSGRNPSSILYDGYGQPLAVLEDDTIFSDQPGLLFAGKDENGLVKFFSVTSSGVLKTAPTGSRTVLGEYYFGSDLITGSASDQNLISLENPAGSGINIYLNRVIINGTVTARFTSTFVYRLSRTTGLPTLGTVQTAQLRASSDIAPSGIIRLVPTATAAAGNLWTGSPGVLTKDGSHHKGTSEAVATFEERKEIILAPGEGILIAADANDSNWSFWANLHWYETAN